MPSLPPVGGITHRSLFAVCAAPTIPLGNRHIAAPPRFANMNAGPGSIAGDNRSPPAWQSNPGSCALLAAGKRAAA
jgi:hypothetical protein